MTGERCLKHRGEYFERYATNEKFEHHFKLHLSHRIALKIGREICSLEFSLCIINIGNMLNQGWAVRMHRPARTTRSVITAAHRISWFLHAPPDYDMHSYDDCYSRWRGQFRVELVF